MKDSKVTFSKRGPKENLGEARMVSGAGYCPLGSPGPNPPLFLTWVPTQIAAMGSPCLHHLAEISQQGHRRAVPAKTGGEGWGSYPLVIYLLGPCRVSFQSHSSYLMVLSKELPSLLSREALSPIPFMAPLGVPHSPLLFVLNFWYIPS